MQNRKRDTEVWNRLLDSVGEGEGGMFKRTASKHVYYLGWNRSPAQVGCMRPALGPGAQGRPRGIGWRGRWEGGSGWGIHVNPWLFHFNVWQNSLQKKKKKIENSPSLVDLQILSPFWPGFSLLPVSHLLSVSSFAHLGLKFLKFLLLKIISSVQSLSRVRLFATQWIAAL